MTKAEATARIERSLRSCEPRLIAPPGTTYEAHVARLSRKLRAAVIEPVRVTVTSTVIEDADFSRYRDAEVWAIAGGPNGWLLTLRGTEEFALGFGDRMDAVMMHGCSSADALGEWCA